MQTVNEALDRLERSKFRSSFHLNKEDFEYISTKGLETVRRHAEDFVRERLAPMKGHPVFKAQHACGCCCRGCLEKWYRVKKGCGLTEAQQQKIVNLLMAWIERQIERNSRL